MERRDFLKTAVLTGAAAAAAGRSAQAKPNPARPQPLATLGELSPAQPRLVHFPDPDSPVYLIQLTHSVPEGVGPERNIVAYSALCTHRGCVVDLVDERLICGCHFSTFDPAKGGQCYQGPASMGLPRVQLEVVDGAIFATGIQGLIWGRARNDGSAA